MEKDIQKAYVISGTIFFLLGGWITYSSWSWPYSTSLGPGPGFFPRWIGILIAASGLTLGLTNALALRKKKQQEPERASSLLFDPSRMLGVGLTAGAICVSVFLLRPLGFAPTIFIFALFLLQIMGKWGWLKSFFLSVAVSVGLFWIFKIWLYIPLPSGILRFFPGF